MQTIQTKEVPPALSALLRAKGQNSYKDVIVAQPAAAVIVENQHTEVPVTSEAEPEVTPEATPAPNPEPVGTRDYEAAWKELKQHHDRTAHELREENKQLKQSLSQAQKPVIKPPKTPEEMKAFKEQYGEAVDYIRTIVLEELQNDTLSSDLKGKLDEVTKAQAELREKEALKKLLELHPDAETIQRDPRFEKWYYEQPKVIQDILAHSSDYLAIAKQLSLYKLEVLGINPKEKKKAQAKELVDASLGVNINGHTEVKAQKKVWTGSEIKQISGNYNQWVKVREELDAARRENRVDWSK